MLKNAFACFDPLSQRILRYVQKDKSQAPLKQRMEKITLRPLVDGECDGEILMSQGNDLGMLLGAGSEQVRRRDQIGVADVVATNAPRVALIANETVRCQLIGDRGFTCARRT